MQDKNFKTLVNGIGNDFKIAIDDIIGVISGIQDDVEDLKIKTSKPDKAIARALLEYIAMDESLAKENINILCGKEIQLYLKWIDNYCNENACSQEQVLNQIIEGEI